MHSLFGLSGCVAHTYVLPPVVKVATFFVVILFWGMVIVPSDVFAGKEIFTTAGSQSWVVPDSVATITVKAWGAGGGGAGGSSPGGTAGGAGGAGGYTQADISVTPGETLTLYVGGAGGAGQNIGATYYTSTGGGGGGFTGVKRGSTALIIAAGGGGGGSGDNSGTSAGGAGGAGGGVSGTGGGTSNTTFGIGGGGATSGGGGSATGAGAPVAGSSLTGGRGGEEIAYLGTGGTAGTNGGGTGGRSNTAGRGGGGGGGGGYYGGGGGGSSGGANAGGGGGGGGSMYVSGIATTSISGVGQNATNTADVDYSGSVGNGGNGGAVTAGGSSGSVGNDGLLVLVLFYTETTTTTTLTTGTDPSSTTIAPGSGATTSDTFTFQTSTSTDTITSVTVTFAANTASATSLIEITNNGGDIVYGSTTVTTFATSTTITLNTNTLTASTSLAQYRIRITPKSHANMPPSPGQLYAITSYVSSWTGTNAQAGTDTGGTTVTIDNEGPSRANSGVTWTARADAADNYWRSVTYGNGTFVAVGMTGTDNRVMTSPDGITWTARTSAGNHTWNSVTYGNGTFVAVVCGISADYACNTTAGDRVMTSPDGITWTSRTDAVDNSWQDVTYGNGLFVAVSSSGTGNRVMTSPDGITWTSRTTPADNSWRSVTYGNGTFVAVSETGTGNRVMRSTDGITWATSTSAADNAWTSVTYGNGTFVAVACGTGTTCNTTAGNRVMTSPDGITWTSRTDAVDNHWYSVTYGNGTFVAVSMTGTGDRVMTSPDGITWATNTSVADNAWQSVVYGNGTFVAVACGTGTTCNTTAGNRVMISTSITASTTPGDSSVTISYTTPNDTDLNSIIILRSTSAVADSPVEGATYSAGNTIGSATVACVDTTVTASTTDSCTATGLTNGVPYYFKVFAKDNYGNYSTGIDPLGSPVTPMSATTLGTGTDPSSTTIAPGSGATTSDTFTFQRSEGTDTITSVTVTFAANTASATSLIEITNNGGDIVYGSTTVTTFATSTTITLNTNTLTASTSLAQYKIRITPKSHANMPPSPGQLYAITSYVSSWTGTNAQAGTDTGGTTVTIDNDEPSDFSSTLTASTRTSPVDNSWTAVTYGNGTFVAVANSGTGNRVMRSTDGITWATSTSAADNNWTAVTYASSTFVAVSSSGTNNRVMTSPDGITWTSRTSAANNAWTSVAYGNGAFVAVGCGSGDTCNNTAQFRVMRSTDGITWATVAFAAGNSFNWNSVTFGNNMFVMVASSSSGTRVATSSDGTSWSLGTSAADNAWTSVTYGNSTFVAVANSGTGNRVMTSPDGSTWTSRTSAGDYGWKSVTYATTTDTFIAVATSSTGYRIMTSSDSGVTWTLASSPADNDWNSVTYGEGKAVAVASSGTGNRVMTIDIATSASTTPSDSSVTISYTTPDESDLHSVVILRSTSAVTDSPVEGTTYSVGNTIGSATVACIDTTVTASTTDSCTATGLTNGTPYHFKVFARDTSGNYSTGDVPTGSPVTPMGILTLSNHSAGQVGNKFDSRNETDIEVFAFHLASGDAEVSEIIFELQGIRGITTSDITSSRLYRDVNANKIYDGGDIAVGGSGTVVIDAKTGTITFGTTFSASTSLDYILVVDASNIMANDSMVISLDISNITATVSIVEDSTPVANIQHIRLGGGGGGSGASRQAIGDPVPAGDGIQTGGGEGGGGVTDPNTGDTIGNEVGFNAPGSNGSPLGTWTNGANAYSSDGTYSTTSGVGAQHSYGTFGFSVPSNNQITGIAVKLEASGSTAAGTISVKLSWDNGTSVTSAQTSSTLGLTDAVYTLGGQGDTWGRSWTPSEMGNGNFAIELIANPSSNTVQLDAIQAKVYYQATGGGGGGGGAI